MHKASKNLNVPPKFRNTNEYYPIYKNEELVEYLKLKISERKADIVQHGFCHSDDQNLPAMRFDLKQGLLVRDDNRKIDLCKYSEFYKAKEKDVNLKVENGRKILEETFNVSTRIFVSPQGLLTDSLWKALRRNNMHYCGEIGSRESLPFFSRVRLYLLLKAVSAKILRTSSHISSESFVDLAGVMLLPATYRHYWNKYIDEATAENWFEIFKDVFRRRREQDVFFILLTHSWEYFYDWEEEITQSRQYQYLYKILQHVNNEPYLWKCSLNEVVSWIIARKGLVVIEKQNKVKIFSPHPISGLSVSADQIDIGHLNEETVQLKRKGEKEFIVFGIEAGGRVTLPIKKCPQDNQRRIARTCPM